jgi:hypothetical protein
VTSFAAAVGLGALALGGTALLGLAARASGLRRGALVALGSTLVAGALVEATARRVVARDAAPVPPPRAQPAWRAFPDLPPWVRAPHHALPLSWPVGPAPADVARVLVVGDSFAHGQGVTDAQTFAAGLATRLHPDDDRRVEVVDIGLPGLSADEERTMYLGYGQAWSPDLVVWMFVPNDLGGGVPASGLEGVTDLIVDRTRPVAGASATWSLLRRGWRARALEAEVLASYRASFSTDRLDGLEAGLREVVGSTTARGARVLFAVFPLLWRLDEAPLAAEHAAALARAAAAGAETLDLASAFAAEDAHTLWATPADHHPNARGHAIAADALAAAIGDRVPRSSAVTCVPDPRLPDLPPCPARTPEGALAWAEALAAQRDPGGRVVSPLVTAFALALAHTGEAPPPRARVDAVVAPMATGLGAAVP